MERVHWLALPAVWALSCITAANGSTGSKEIAPTNLLFIMFDDLRPQLRHYGIDYMITPNFDRLASKSVTFDYAYTQIAVCNPARDSLLTGLRPDTVGTYAFGESFRPSMIFPTQLQRSGYTTASYGKILHWDQFDKDIWNEDHDNMNWYIYQTYESDHMNSTTMPDKNTPEEQFRDYIFASKAINQLRQLSSKEGLFALALGFKMPHLSLHVPYKYYEMYKNKTESWRLSTKELTYPPSSPMLSYRCCAEISFNHMKNEGASVSTNRKYMHPGDPLSPFTTEMRDELMMGYAAAVTFVDKRLGRLLDAIDELALWEKLTVVLTADHGMHNGEKGLWEKWTLFDESTRVPLMIHHPLSPFKGRHYRLPVELIDVYPTLIDLLNPPFDQRKVCGQSNKQKTTWIYRCLPLQGKSLARVVIGDSFTPSAQSLLGKSRNSKGQLPATEQPSPPLPPTATKQLPDTKENSFGHGDGSDMPILRRDFAISQLWRCALKKDVYLPMGADRASPIYERRWSTISSSSVDRENRPVWRRHIWRDCDKKDRSVNFTQELSVMGYSMRTTDYRYTMWLPFNRELVVPYWNSEEIYDEELYDHRGESLQDFTHREIMNMIDNPDYVDIRELLRLKMRSFIAEIVYLGPVVKMRYKTLTRNGTAVNEEKLMSGPRGSSTSRFKERMRQRREKKKFIF